MPSMQDARHGGAVFVVAMEREADAVRPHLRPGDRLVVCGVGKVNAAAATQRAVCEGAAEIWNAGLAGGFGAGMRVGDCVVIDRAVEYDFDLSEVNGTRIGVLDGRDTPYFPCAADFAPDLPRATLASGDRFGDSFEVRDAATIAALGASVRDMEGAAVAHVCEANGVPCRMLKAISDVHGAGSMVGQYEASREAALFALSDAVREALRPCRRASVRHLHLRAEGRQVC